MKNTNQNQSAITLIALIITIIVMLILAGVTINIAINGGLFQQASNAVIATDIAGTREQLQMELLAEIMDKGKNITVANVEAILSEYTSEHTTPVIDINNGIITFPGEQKTKKRK